MIQPAGVPKMNITLVDGPEASRLLRDDTFRERWLDLYHRCPWATVFQTPTFLDPWFEIYADLHPPLLVMGSRAEGRLDGFLILVHTSGSAELAHAGTHHAEYQVWMSAPEDGNLFIELAIDELVRRFPKGSLKFLYLPAAAPLEWAAPGSRWSPRCDVQPFPVPLLELGDRKAIDSLRKKRMRKGVGKWRLEELERMGGIHFEEIGDPDCFRGVFDDIIDYCDLRQGAMYNQLPFRRDDRKKLLYLAMARVAGLLHITVLRIAGQVVSVCIDYQNRGQELLGIITHSPFFADYSLGTQHILTLATRLSEQQAAAQLDLSPGGGYKDRFATRFEECHILMVRFDAGEARRLKQKQRLVDAVRDGLTKTRLLPAAKLAASVSRAPAAHWASLRARAWSTVEVPLYALEADRIEGFAKTGSLRRDSLADLLALRPPRFQSFLQTALGRLEKSGHVYTSAQDPARRFSIWTSPLQSNVFIAEAGVELSLPEGCAAVYDFAATVPDSKVYEDALRQSIRQEFGGTPGLRRVYTWIGARSHEQKAILEKLGFAPAGVVRKTGRAGRFAIDVPALQ